MHDPCWRFTPPRPPHPAAGRLLQLKLIFPGANSSLLAMRQPELVLGFDMVSKRWENTTTTGTAGLQRLSSSGACVDFSLVCSCAAPVGCTLLEGRIGGCRWSLRRREAALRCALGGSHHRHRHPLFPAQARLEGIAAELRELLPALNIGAHRSRPAATRRRVGGGVARGPHTRARCGAHECQAPASVAATPSLTQPPAHSIPLLNVPLRNIWGGMK